MQISSCAPRAGDEPLATVEPPSALHPCGRGGEEVGIGAGTRRRLGHGKARPDIPPGQRGKVAGLLPLVGDHLQKVHIPLIGGSPVDGQGTEERVAGLFEDDRLPAEVEAHATPDLGHVRREHPPAAGGLLELPAEGFGTMVQHTALRRFGRQGHLPDERRRSSGNLGGLVIRLEVDRHGASLSD